jgi:hypothetical protein
MGRYDNVGGPKWEKLRDDVIRHYLNSEHLSTICENTGASFGFIKECIRQYEIQECGDTEIKEVDYVGR